jgi:hypothetical protein
MTSLARQRCLNHEAREAVCRCPSCRNFFCRECVALFESRLLCAACLAIQANEPETPGAKQPKRFAMAAWALLALLFAWLFFYFAGWSMLQFRERAVIAALGIERQVRV